MKKKVKRASLSRTSDQREALLRTMTVSLVRYGRLKTTVSKAKVLRPYAERMLTHAKLLVIDPHKSIAKRRLLARRLPVKTVERLITIAEFMKERKGGYTRIMKLGSRKSDASPMAIIEWTEKIPAPVKDQSKAKLNPKTPTKKKQARKVGRGHFGFNPGTISVPPA